MHIGGGKKDIQRGILGSDGSVMSAVTFPRGQKRGQRPGGDAGRCAGGGYDEYDDCLRQLSACAACGRERGGVLILPCSHTMCVGCVAAGGGARSGRGRGRRRGASPPACSVPCPRCCHAVELPCRSPSSATSCLPRHPGLRSARTSWQTGVGEGASEDDLQHQQGGGRRGDAVGEPARGCLHGFSARSSPASPADGDVDLREEDMEKSVSGLWFALDPSTLPSSLRLSSSSLTVTYQDQTPPGPPPDGDARGRAMTPDPGPMPPLPQVCADVVIARGQYYWEVDVCNSSIYRIGVSSADGAGGWWLQRLGALFHAVYDGGREPLHAVPPQIKTLGVFLNLGGGALSFHNTLTQEHLVTLPTRFRPAGVLPALGLGQGRLRLRCGLPPPPHVFLSKDSAYRGSCGPGAGGLWRRRRTPFRSVRKMIEKFEELAASDSDSGPASRLGSSRSTSSSLPDSGIAGTFPGTGNTGQETE